MVRFNASTNFSQLSKQEWIDLINRYEFSIRITSKDSLENLLKKLINHLYSVPREKIERDAKDTKSAEHHSKKVLQLKF
jgi:hypothetical protein